MHAGTVKLPPTPADLTTLRRQRRERVVTGVVELMLDTFVVAGVPSEYFPPVEVFKKLVSQVNALMIAQDF
jgi:hypothetical protein